MTVEWTEHRFSSGVLALDVANTAVLRNDPERCFDRFDNAEEIGRFAEVASVRVEELRAQKLVVADAHAIKPQVIFLREAIDRLFRRSAETGVLQGRHLAEFLAACSRTVGAVEGLSIAVQARPEPMRFEAAVAVSALSLLRPDRLKRIRICGNCSWLFLDKSRNGSRLWCDMAVCGNRQKAKRHYRKRKNRQVGHV